MEYREIVSVTGLGGLFHLITTKSDGAIVRNITDGTTKFISARTHNVTPLDSIEVYTMEDNVRLSEVFKSMKEQEDKTPLVDAKKSDNDTIKGYFTTIFPSFDLERVYVSDMKKMLKWYKLLNEHDLLNFEEPEAVEEEVATEEPVEEKPAKKKATKKKKTAAKKETAKKKTAKKKTED